MKVAKAVKLGAVVLAGWRLVGPVVSPRFSGNQEHPWRVPASTVFVGDQEFIVRQVGDPTKPDLVLIHGLGGASLTEWYEVGPRLEDEFRLTILENRSHGLSPRVTKRYEISDIADDVSALMTALGLERAHVAGYSMGGTVAQALTHQYPEKVDRLILIATFAFHPSAWKWSRMVGTILTRGWERVTGLGTPEVRAGYLVATGAVDTKHAKFMWEETHRRDPDAGAAASMALFRFDSREWVSDIAKKTLVMIPTKDQLVPVKWQEDLAGRLRDVETVYLQNARHEVVWTHPEEISKSMLAFLSD